MRVDVTMRPGSTTTMVEKAEKMKRPIVLLEIWDTEKDVSIILTVAAARRLAAQLKEALNG